MSTEVHGKILSSSLLRVAEAKPSLVENFSRNVLNFQVHALVEHCKRSSVFVVGPIALSRAFENFLCEAAPLGLLSSFRLSVDNEMIWDSTPQILLTDGQTMRYVHVADANPDPASTAPVSVLVPYSTMETALRADEQAGCIPRGYTDDFLKKHFPEPELADGVDRILNGNAISPDKDR